MVLAALVLLTAGAAVLGATSSSPSPAYSLTQAADTTLGSSGFVAVVASGQSGAPARREAVRALYQAPDRLLEAVPAGSGTVVVTAVGARATWSSGGPFPVGLGFDTLSGAFLGPLYALGAATDVRRAGSTYRFVVPSLSFPGVRWIAYAPLASPASTRVAERTYTYTGVRGSARVSGGAVAAVTLHLAGSPRVVLRVRYLSIGSAPAVPDPGS